LSPASAALRFSCSQADAKRRVSLAIARGVARPFGGP
jgi:hypothetical protein